MRRSIVVLLACGSVFGACYVTGPPAGFECTQDSDCDRGSLCIDAECFKVCTLQMHCGEGQYCSPDGICMDNPPRISAPTGLSAEGGLSKVTVTWEPVSGAVSYNVYWAVEPGVTTASTRESTTTPPFEHTSLANGATYYYAVTAVDEAGESDLSDEVSATAVGPSAPTGVSAEGGVAQVTLTWEPVSGADSYNIYWALQSGVTTGSSRLTATAPPLVHAPLTNGTTYYYAVSSVVEGSESALSEEVSATARDPFAPSQVSAQGGMAEVTLSWEPVSGADSYNVYWAPQSGVTSDSDRMSAVAPPLVHTQLVNGTTYYYAVTTVDGSSESVLSGEVSATTFVDPSRLVALDAEPYDHISFGGSVALTGDCAIVGASFKDGDGDAMGNAGAAYVFERTGANTWAAGTKLVAPDPQRNGRFGFSVAVSGDYAIVGALVEDSDDGTLDYAGAAYVFQRTGADAWDAGTELAAPDPQAAAVFGFSVALGDDYAVVGAPWKDAVYVFERTGANTWDGGTKVVTPDAQSGEFFGQSVATSGDYFIIGAPNRDGDGDALANAGAAFVFLRTGANSWDAGTRLVAPDAQASDHFGSSVAVVDDHAIVGAPREDGDGPVGFDAGAAYLFLRTGANAWDGGTKLVSPKAQRDGWLGESVALSGDHVLVGAAHEDGDAAALFSAGAAYLFRRTGTNTWTGASLVAPQAHAHDHFGIAVALTSGYAMVGALGEDGAGDMTISDGAAYVYEY